jgi:hypothetical protein
VTNAASTRTTDGAEDVEDLGDVDDAAAADVEDAPGADVEDAPGADVEDAPGADVEDDAAAVVDAAGNAGDASDATAMRVGASASPIIPAASQWSVWEAKARISLSVSEGFSTIGECPAPAIATTREPGTLAYWRSDPGETSLSRVP